MSKFKLIVCKGRLRQLNKPSKPSPTNIKGSESAMKNHIRRRIAPIKKTYQDKNKKWFKEKYGPLFGMKKQNIDRSCNGDSKNKGSLGYSSNSGTNEDIVYFKSLYGGVRRLGNCKDIVSCPCKEQKFVNGKAIDCDK